jgi:peptide/nickel transport system permease protein
MGRFLFHRLALLPVTLLGVISLVFFLTRVLPGDPVEAILGETASPLEKQALRRQLGLDRPLGEQYRDFLSRLARGDLGRSLQQQESVSALIFARFPATLELALAALTLAVLISFPLSAAAASRPGSALDRLALAFSVAASALPSYWLGPLLILVFSVNLGWLPVSGREGLLHLWLPALTLAVGLAALLTRMLRSSLLEAAGADFVRAARARGLPERRVWLKHVLGAALLPTITLLGLQFGSLLAGAIIVETIFSWPGIGRLAVQAIQTRDYPLLQGCVLAISLSYLIVNLLTDLVYSWIDPRIRYER